jgi:hypothetical protein
MFGIPLHLTKEVRPYVISRFGASSAPAQWAVVGWSMGGTCAIDRPDRDASGPVQHLPRYRR